MNVDTEQNDLLNGLVGVIGFSISSGLDFPTAFSAVMRT